MHDAILSRADTWMTSGLS